MGIQIFLYALCKLMFGTIFFEKCKNGQPKIFFKKRRSFHFEIKFQMKMLASLLMEESL